MKVPLRFQVSEFDCGPVSLMNALSFLFEREEIPVCFLKYIYKFTLDAKNKSGNKGEAGTSQKALIKLANLLEKVAKKRNIKVFFKLLEKSEVTEKNIRKFLKSNGCVIVRCYYQMVEHYVLITQMDKYFAYIFDPYYLNCSYFDDDYDVQIDLNHKFAYNRIVKLRRLFNGSKKDFSLMETGKRQALLINKI